MAEAKADLPTPVPTVDMVATEMGRLKTKLNELIREHRQLYERVVGQKASPEQKEPTKLDYYNQITAIDNLISQAQLDLTTYGLTYISASAEDPRALCLDRLARLKENRKMLMEMFASAKN